MYVTAIVGGALTFAWDAFAVFLAFTAITLCLGHSLGMHRLLIHRSYACPKLVEYFFVYCGVLVGLAGPRGMMRTHDTRDWAQRQERCHPYFAHRRTFLVDGCWQLFCDVRLADPPSFRPPDIFERDRVYRFLERTWMLQQLPWVVVLGLLGGLSWIVWGVAVRVAVCVTGHWLIGWFAHNAGQRTWHVEGAAVQATTFRYAGSSRWARATTTITTPFPARRASRFRRGQLDPGWWVLCTLARLHIVWDVKLPADLPSRNELRFAVGHGPGSSVCTLRDAPTSSSS